MLTLGLSGHKHRVEIAHPDQLWWADQGIRKRDVIAYYAAVAPVLLPHLRDRPLTIKQHYNGPRSPFRWIKDAPPETPPWVPVSPQPAKSRGGALVRYVVIRNRRALLWAVEYGAIDLHVWPSRIDRPDRPDYVLFDLDPVDVPYADVAGVALQLRDALAALGLESCAKTTGGEGLHVQVPIARRHTHAEARRFAEVVGGAIARRNRLVTTKRSLDRPRGILIDTAMNGHGQQIVAPYSLRPRPEAAVAAPLRWEEVDDRLDPAELTMARVLERVARDGDLFEPVLRGRQLLKPALARLSGA
ncbi:MAG: DNA polymerase domain-containing protein [Gaiellaceae bacterium]